MSDPRLVLLPSILGLLVNACPARAADAAPRPADVLRFWNETPEPGGGMQIPQAHPYLTLTSDDIKLANDRASQWDWARNALARCRQEADRYVDKPWDKLPEKGDTEHWSVASRLFSVGLAYALSGQPRYAEWTRDGLLAYARLYPGLPPTNGRCRVFTQSSLYEAMWLCNIVRAYDLVADSGAFTDDQKRLVETDLLRTAVRCFLVEDFQNDPRIRDLHYRSRPRPRSPCSFCAVRRRRPVS